MLHRILNRFSGKLIIEVEAPSIKAALEIAVKREANLGEANLGGANLREANLREANLWGADLDFSAWPLWCGAKNVKIDERLTKQLLYHALCNGQGVPGLTQEFIDYVNGFHRVGEVPALELSKLAREEKENG